MNCHILDVSVTLELGISSVEPVKGGFVLLNFNRRRMQVSLAGRDPVWVYIPKGRGECVCGVGVVQAVGSRKSSCMESQMLILRCCSQGLVLTNCKFSVWFFFFFETNLRNCALTYFSFWNTMDMLPFKNSAKSFSPFTLWLFFPPHLKWSCFKEWG